jgi:excisionase family DNA binding protein
MEEKELPIAEAVKLSGYSKPYLARLAKRGDIQARMLGPIWLIDRASLQAYMTTPHKSGPKGPIKKKLPETSG